MYFKQAMIAAFIMATLTVSAPVDYGKQYRMPLPLLEIDHYSCTPRLQP